MTTYESFYSGGEYSLDDPYKTFIGYRVSAGQLGAPLKPDTAAQIVEATNMLNQGMKPIEVGVLSPEIFDQIPKQHFKEINRLTKLTGSKASLHAPLVEASGIIENVWSEDNQRIAERHLIEVVDKAYDLEPDGNTPVTFHSSNIPGKMFGPGDKKGEIKENVITAINVSTGKIEAQFKEEERAYPETIAEYGKAQIQSAEEQLDTANYSQWRSKIQSLAEYKKNADEVIGDSLIKLGNVLELEGEKGKIGQEILGPSEVKAINQLERANIFLKNVETSFGAMFEEAWKYSDDKYKEKLKEIAEDWTKPVELHEREMREGKFESKPLNYTAKLIHMKSELLNKAINELYKMNQENHFSPAIYRPVEEFALDKSSDTFSKVAFHSYKKYKDKAPIISIENLYPGMAFGKPEDMNELIKVTREKFVEQAVADGIGKEVAQKAAEKTIGMTLDVGHLNLMKKQGFDEDALIKATKKFGKYVKHIHLTDNFGYSDSHLPIGMGNVPVKAELEALEKAGVDLKNIKLINEAGGFAQHFKVSPHPATLAAFGSPIYSAKLAPYWNQGGVDFGYFAGYGTMLPEQHFSMYGSGFSGLPTELGGQIQSGKSSRFSGTPND